MANKVMMGKVIRDKNDKTIVVSVETSRQHPLYKKYVRYVKNYHVHDENNQFKVGDSVRFVLSRPFSKLKKWKVVE